MIINILIIVLCIAADQLTKICAAANLKDISTLPIIENIFHFTYVENRGAAFGMLSEHRWVFMILSVVGIAAIFVYLTVTKPKSWWMRLALCFIVGGGVGNMIDRIARGYVIDFIDCGICLGRRNQSRSYTESLRSRKDTSRRVCACSLVVPYGVCA